MGRLILAAIAISVVVWLFIAASRRRSGRILQPKSAIAGVPGRDLKALRLVCRGDESRVTRLIEYEKERSPGISNKQACRRAVARLKRDNR